MHKMCIMEVRPGQHDSTIAQANAHNVNTVVGDLDLWIPILETRTERAAGGDRLYGESVLTTVKGARQRLHAEYAVLLGLFGSEVARAVEHWQQDHGPLGTERDHHHGDDGRVLVDAMNRAVRLGREYETR